MAKKISAIVSIVIIGILILTTIIMATVDVDHKIKCNDPDVIYVRYSSFDKTTTEDQKDKIVDLIDNASKEKSLVALFNGHIGDHAYITLNSTTPVSINDNGGFYVIYHYAAAQDLIVDNKVAKDENGETIKFSELVFVVSDFDGMTDVRVYVTPYGADSFTYSRYYTVRADFGELYSYLNAQGFKN